MSKKRNRKTNKKSDAQIAPKGTTVENSAKEENTDLSVKEKSDSEVVESVTEGEKIEEEKKSEESEKAEDEKKSEEGEKKSEEDEKKSEEGEKTEDEKKSEEDGKKSEEDEKKSEEGEKTEDEKKSEESEKTEDEKKSEEGEKTEVEKKTEESEKTEDEKKSEEGEKTEAEKKTEDKPSESVNEDKKDKKKFPVWAIVCIACFVLLAAAYGAGVIYFSGHFAWKTTLNGADVSCLTVDQVQADIDQKFRDYSLTIEERGGRTEQIRAKDIDLDFTLQGTVQDILDSQNHWIWFLNGFYQEDLSLNADVSYDAKLLTAAINSLSLMDESLITEPVEPQIVEKSREYVVVDGIEGNQPQAKKVLSVVSSAIDRLHTSVNLEKENCYESLKYDSDDPEVQDALKAMNTIKQMKIIYDFGEEKVNLWGYRIEDWVSLDEDYQITFDEEAMLSYIDYMKENHKVRGQVVDFDTYYGSAVELTSYVKTAVIDSEAEVSKLQEIILDACEKGETECVRSTENMFSIGDTYIEINLTAQKMFCHKDGRIILETDIVSGRPSTGCATPPGIYNIFKKASPAILVGDTYRTPVSYWMPFNGGIGLHDATWQSAFGGMRYLTNGSHGCINLRLDVAKFLYENYEVGDLVILYHMEGTESSETTPAGRASSSPVPVYTEATTEEATEAPAEEPPAEQPPAEQPPAEQPPAEQPPAEPPAEQPPAEQPPAEQPPAEQPPAEQPAEAPAEVPAE